MSPKTPYFTAKARIDGFEETLKMLNNILPNLLSYKIANAFSLIGADLLAHAQPRVPIDTGQLRESGRVTLRAGRGASLVVATGNADGTITANLGLFKSANLKKARSFRLNVGYRRTGRSGDDIALWTHETLLPHEERPPYSKRRGSLLRWARTPGTGPKYLEIAFMERADRYLSFLKNVLDGKQIGKDIELGSKVTKRARGRYDVNIKEAVLDRVFLIGYRNIISSGGDIVQAIKSPPKVTSYY